MPQPEAQFLHQRDPNLHISPDVEHVTSYLRAGGEHIPNQPDEKISAYLGFLANREYANDGILTGDQTSIDRQIEAHVIKAEDVPEGYFELQRRIAREQGHGDIQITPQMREQLTEAVQTDQRAGLGKWVEYLGGSDGGYPDWFKFYTFGSVTKLGSYDKEKSEFQKRSKGTTSPFPDLNREALAYVYDVLNKSRVQGEKVDGGANDEQLQKLLQGANFGKLYAHAVLEVTPTSDELLKDTRGSWTMFNQTADPRTARRLSESLQGRGTGWCTAGESTAAIQLQGGDFYVYYTRDEKGNDTIPRVAIRMQDGQVAEVRGVNAAQELEPVMADITSERLKDLPGGEEYIQKAEDMKQLTAIEKKIAKDPQTTLTPSEIALLYELDHEVQGFGYEKDPRVAEIRASRGEADYPELKTLLTKNIEQQLQTSLSTVNTIIEQLNGLRRRRERLPSIGRPELEDSLISKLEEWEQNGSLEWCVRQMAEHGGKISLVATPNTVAETKEVIELAKTFGEGQPYETYVYDELYSQYSGEELSGPLAKGSEVKFSLISGGLDRSLDGTVDSQRTTLKERRATTPSLRVPSVLESIAYWQTLRAQGDKLDDSTAFDKTYIRHFDLEPKQLGDWLGVPRSYVNRDGSPYLYRSDAEASGSARLAVG